MQLSDTRQNVYGRQHGDMSDKPSRLLSLMSLRHWRQFSKMSLMSLMSLYRHGLGYTSREANYPHRAQGGLKPWKTCETTPTASCLAARTGAFGKISNEGLGYGREARQIRRKTP
jgi:hypothetical protein